MSDNKVVKKKKSGVLSKVLIIVGVILIIIGVLYEVLNYPWKTLFKDGETINQTVLPQPKEIGQTFTYYYENDATDEVVSTLPAAVDTMPVTRPAKDLVMLGNIKIPRIDLSENIIEGAGEEILYAVGHLSGTPLPSEDGNFVLAGHRNYVWMHPFKHLDKLENGDLVQVEIYEKTGTIRYTYEIYDTATVYPEDTWVLNPQAGESRIITLITCTPVPAYTYRLIFYGRLIGEEAVS